MLKDFIMLLDVANWLFYDIILIHNHEHKFVAEIVLSFTAPCYS